MTDRQVYVQLELDLGKYTGKVPEAVAGTKSIDDKVKELDKDLGGLDRALDKTGRNMVETAVETGALNRELANTRDRLRELEVRFDQTGDTNLLKKIRTTRSEMQQLERVAKDLAKTVEDAIKPTNNDNNGGFFSRMFSGGRSLYGRLFSEGQTAGQVFSGGFGTTFFNILKAGVSNPAGWVAILAAASMLGVMIGGVLLTGIGLGGLAAGIAGAFASPRIKDALSSFTKELKTGLVDAAVPFIQPLAMGIGILKKGFRDALPGIKDTLAALAPAVEGFATGLSGFLTGFVTGLEHAMVASKPLLEEFSKFLPRLGDAFGSLFDTIGKNSKEAKEGLQAFEGVLLGIVYGTEGAIIVFSRLWDVLKYINALWLAQHWFKEYPMNVEKIASAVNKVTDQAPGVAKLALTFDDLNTQLNKVAVTSDSLTGSMVDKLLGPTLALDKASNDFDKTLITLGDALEANGGHLSEHVKQLKKTETGFQQNKDAILAVVEANLRMYDSQLAVGVSAEDAAAKYDQNTKALEDQLRAAGWTAAEIDGLIGKYRGVPKNVNTSIALLGLTEAITQLNETLRLINGLPPLRTVTVHVKQVFDNPNLRMPGTAYAGGGIRKAAAGMIVGPSNPGSILMGEPQTGGEVLTPLRGISQAHAIGLTQVVGNSYGFDVMPRGAMGGRGVVFNLIVNAGLGTNGREVGAQIAEALRPYIRSGYGGSAQAALGAAVA